MAKNGKKLLIVESPTKARTITRMVGNDFNIMASMGHIRDLPERELGVDIEHDFAPQYVAAGRSGKVVSDLKNAAREADEISNGRKGKQVIFRSKTYCTGHGERQKEVLLRGH